MCVKNTFLDTEFLGLQALERSLQQGSRRAKSTGPVWPARKELTELEQATLDSLNGLLGCKKVEQSPDQALAATKHFSNSFLRSACQDAWDSEVECGLYKAWERATWMVKHCGLSLEKARLQVMQEFPKHFGSEGQQPHKQQCPVMTKTSSSISLSTVCPEDWDCEVWCDGHSAKDRAQWVVEDSGLPMDRARLRVMQEFPADFSRHQHDSSEELLAEMPAMKKRHSCSSLSTVCLEDWDCEVECGLHKTAGERADWLVKECGLSVDEARLRVMKEFPTNFGRHRRGESEEDLPLPGAKKRSLSSSSVSTMCPEDWDGNEFCDGHTAAGRARWVAENFGLALNKARRRIMYEFPEAFARQPPQSGKYDELSGSPAPKILNLADLAETVESPSTTMMIRNIPTRYTQQELMEELDNFGFTGSFDFFYAPKDFSTMKNMGYTFINFITPTWAARCKQDLEGYAWMKHQQKTRRKFATVSVAHLQGLEANLRHYEKSAVAKRTIAKHCKCAPVVIRGMADEASTGTSFEGDSLN